MKRAAVIGAGFAGLATAYHLCKENFPVTLFDKKGVGGGASGIALGLVHPHPGEQCRRSQRAEEGLAATKELLSIAETKLGRPVANYDGVIRIAFDEEAVSNLLKYPDVERIDETRFLIKSGITVFTQNYLQGLWLSCQELGAKLLIQTIEEIPQDYDFVVIAAGAGSIPLCPTLPLKQIKGQVLECLGTPPEKSIVGKGYIAKGESTNTFHLGATFERTPLSKREVFKELQSKYSKLTDNPFPDILDCKAAFRVTHPQGYFPLTKQLNEKTWALTAFGSRGLLYHALVAKEFVACITEGKRVGLER